MLLIKTRASQFSHIKGNMSLLDKFVGNFCSYKNNQTFLSSITTHLVYQGK